MNSPEFSNVWTVCPNSERKCFETNSSLYLSAMKSQNCKEQLCLHLLQKINSKIVFSSVFVSAMTCIIDSKIIIPCLECHLYDRSSF